MGKKKEVSVFANTSYYAVKFRHPRSAQQVPFHTMYGILYRLPAKEHGNMSKTIVAQIFHSVSGKFQEMFYRKMSSDLTNLSIRLFCLSA